MTILKLHIRFILRSGDLYLNGYATLRCRLTYNKQRKDFSTGISINPNYWDPK